MGGEILLPWLLCSYVPLRTRRITMTMLFEV